MTLRPPRYLRYRAAPVGALEIVSVYALFFSSCSFLPIASTFRYSFHFTLRPGHYVATRRDSTRGYRVAYRYACTYGAPLKDTPVCGPYCAPEYPLIGVLTLASLAIFIVAARGLRVNAVRARAYSRRAYLARNAMLEHRVRARALARANISCRNKH